MWDPVRPEVIMETLSKEGLEITLNEARNILEVLNMLAAIAIQQTLNEENNGYENS